MAGPLAVPLLGALILATVAGCQAVPVSLPGAGAANDGLADMVENRIWVDPEAGDYRVFLSEGVLIEGRCRGPALFGYWRWRDDGLLSWTGAEGEREAGVVVAGPRDLVLTPDPDDPVTLWRFEAARDAQDCPG